MITWAWIDTSSADTEIYDRPAHPYTQALLSAVPVPDPDGRERREPIILRDGTPLSEEQLLTILEAASWAPSAYNAQPWRFVHALRGTPEFDRLLGVRVG